VLRQHALFHPTLKMHASNLGPPLPPATHSHLQHQYVLRLPPHTHNTFKIPGHTHTHPHPHPHPNAAPARPRSPSLSPHPPAAPARPAVHRPPL
jgi:hypothetical protein